VIPYDKWSHERIRGLLIYMHYTDRRILYFTLQTQHWYKTEFSNSPGSSSAADMFSHVNMSLTMHVVC